MTKTLYTFIILFCWINISFSQDTLILKSELIPANDTTLVFTPFKYKSLKNYPVVFLLHGWSGNYNQWNEITKLQTYANRFNFIIVCPDGFYDSWYVDSPVKQSCQFKTFFFNVLTKTIFEKYSIDKSNIFISGLSMGGFGAITLFASNTNFFKSAASTSGILDIIPFASKWGMSNYLGSYEENKEFWSQITPVNNIQQIKKSGKKIIFDCGSDDFAYDVNKNFYDECRKYKVPATFISQPGNHNREYWKKTIEAHFKFFKSLTKE